MPSGGSGLGVNVDGLRERLPHQPEAPVKAANVNAAQDAVKVLNDEQAKEEKDEKDKKTFGRTPDGTGAYNIPSSSNGCRVEYVWDGESRDLGSHSYWPLSGRASSTDFEARPRASIHTAASTRNKHPSHPPHSS